MLIRPLVIPVMVLEPKLNWVRVMSRVLTIGSANREIVLPVTPVQTAHIRHIATSAIHACWLLLLAVTKNHSLS